MINLTLDYTVFEQNLRKEVKTKTDTSKLFPIIAQQEIREIQQRIRTTKLSPEGKQWEPWSYSTIKAMGRNKQRRSLLYHTGNLLNSFSYRINNNQLRITNSTPYGRFLQNGTNKMPARPFMGWNQGSQVRIKKIYGIK